MTNHSMPKVLCAIAATIATVASLLTVLAQSVPPPVLKIALTNGTQFQITITNAVATTNYEIYRTPLLNNTNFPWTLDSVGSVGQSNFVLDMEGESTGFFRAGVGSDWDLDGIPNSQDANPTDPTLGILTITIDSPTNGATLN
jgi:hypothetical protein